MVFNAVHGIQYLYEGQSACKNEPFFGLISGDDSDNSRTGQSRAPASGSYYDRNLSLIGSISIYELIIPQTAGAA